MIGGRLSLVRLVEAARDRELARQPLKRWLIDDRKWPVDLADACYWDVREYVAEVCELCRGGRYGEACSLVYLFLPGYRAGQGSGGYLLDSDLCPAWQAFAGVVTLSERIDGFLTTVGRGPLAPLARDCRGDLDLLLVLADCCQDSGLPHSAAEARHLHSLVVSHLRGSAGEACVRPSAPEDDYQPDLE